MHTYVLSITQDDQTSSFPSRHSHHSPSLIFHFSEIAFNSGATTIAFRFYFMSTVPKRLGFSGLLPKLLLLEKL